MFNMDNNLKYGVIGAILLLCLTIGSYLLPQEKNPWEGMSTEGGWANESWTYVIPIDINTTVATNLTNFPARVSIDTSNATLWNTTTCTNVRFYDYNNTTLLNYDLDSSSPVFCGNATNNATFWVSGNYTGGALTRIYAYLGNTGAASGENEATVWKNANYVGVWHMNENTTLVDSAGYNNASSTTCPPPTIGKLGYEIYFNAACKYTKDNPVGLPSGAGIFNAISIQNRTDAYFTPSIGWGAQSSNRMIIMWIQNTTGTYTYRWEGYATGFNSATVAQTGYQELSYSYLGGGISSIRFLNATAIAETNATYTPNIGTTKFAMGANPDGYTLGSGRAHITEQRISNTTRTYDWNVAEYAQTAIVGATDTLPPSLNVTFGTGISAIYFNASTFVSKNVSATNQSASVPLFNVTNIGSVNATLLCNQSPSISGVSVKCAKTYNTSAALPCNTSAPSIGNLSANTSTGVWCWADFYFPTNKTGSVTINITGG